MVVLRNKRNCRCLHSGWRLCFDHCWSCQLWSFNKRNWIGITRSSGMWYYIIWFIFYCCTQTKITCLGCHWRYHWSKNNTKAFSYWCIWNWSFARISNWYNPTCWARMQRIRHCHRKRKIISFHCHAAWFSCWITWSKVRRSCFS